MMVQSTLAPTSLLLAFILVSLSRKSLVSSRSTVMSRNVRSCLIPTPRNLVVLALSRWLLLIKPMPPRKVFKVKSSKAEP